ncbi:hypothetical protein M2326_000939 [Flavobacterium sp. 7A]|nr:hypothetical protein [Flavobacterium sp. 7A]
MVPFGLISNPQKEKKVAFGNHFARIDNLGMKKIFKLVRRKLYIEKEYRLKNSTTA